MISEPELGRPTGGFDSFCHSAFSSVCKRESGGVRAKGVWTSRAKARVSWRASSLGH